MKYERFERNLIDTIQEAQIKLGYDSRPMSLNYALSSLNNLMGTSAAPEEMNSFLEEFCKSAKEKFGEIGIKQSGNMFCITIPAKGADYVHENTENSGFIFDFINTVRSSCNFESVLEVFHRYSDKVHVKKSCSDEFDYLVYFEDGIPDSYRYCITLEGICITYHRFTKEDYDAFSFL